MAASGWMASRTHHTTGAISAADNSGARASASSDTLEATRRAAQRKGTSSTTSEATVTQAAPTNPKRGIVSTFATTLNTSAAAKAWVKNRCLPAAISTYWVSPLAKLNGRYQIRMLSATAESGRKPRPPTRVTIGSASTAVPAASGNAICSSTRSASRYARDGSASRATRGNSASVKLDEITPAPSLTL